MPGFPFSIFPKLPLLCPSSRAPADQAPNVGRAASKLSSCSGGLRPSPSASRCAQHHKEAFPQINFGIEAIGACARLFFFGSGRIGLHRRHFNSGDPRPNYSLHEYPLGTLYSTPSLTRALFFSRSPAPWTSPCRRRLPSPARLRPPRLPPTTLSRSRYSEATRASPNLCPLSPVRHRAISTSRPAAASPCRAVTVPPEPQPHLL